MKILVISYDYYPENTPNTYRWGSVLNEWARQGHDVYVISGLKNSSIQFEIVKGVEIYRTGEGIYGKIKYSSANHSLAKISLKKKKSPSFLSPKGLLKLFYNATLAKLFWPDHAFLWYFSALSKAEELIVDKNIDSLITVSWPFTSHLVGSTLKRKNPFLRWVADTIDPFYFNKYLNNHFLFKKLNFVQERKVFQRTDVVSVLTDNLKEKYSSIYPESKDKIKVNKNIYNPKEFNFKKNRTSDIIRIIYVGMLSDVVRSPRNTLIILKNIVKNLAVLKIEIHFYGDVDQSKSTFDEFIELEQTSFFLHGKKKKSEINNILKEADILLNIGNSNEYQEPSKLIEYMYTRKPILNICSIENDSSKVLLAKYPLSLSIFPRDVNSLNIYEQIINLYNSTESVDIVYLNDILKDYLLPSIEKRYLSFLTTTFNN